MYAGDQGQLTVTRTAAIGGQPPPNADPIRAEFKNLAKLDPAKLVPAAKSFLAQLGVNKISELGTKPNLIVVGEPRIVMRGERLVVWKLMNEEIPGWGRLSGGPGDNGQFTDRSSATGLYTGDVLGANPAVYVHKLAEGQIFLDTITASVIEGGIVFNSHASGWSQCIYHEILHTFEDGLLSSSFFLKEGFVEWFGGQFMLLFGVREPYFPPYALAARNIEKVITFTDVKTCAKAYFNGDKACASAFVPLFYDKIIASQLNSMQKIDPTCVSDAKMKCRFIKDSFSTWKMKKGLNEGAWYKTWVAAHGKPAGGPDLT